MLRRTFLETGGAAVAASAKALGAAGIRLGYDTYSIRAYRWKAIQLLDYAAGLKLDTIQLSGLNDYESLEPAHLRKVKDHAARLGIAIDAGIGCICPISAGWSPRNGSPEQYLLRGLRVARAVGSTSVRCFMGSPADRRGPEPIDQHIERTIGVFRAVRSQALESGVKIALENHGDLSARELKTLIEESGREHVGCCLDSGNPISVLEDPQLTLEVLAPYAVTTHVRDSALFEHPRGAAFQWVALGDGSIDFRRWIATLKRLAPNVSVQLEIITGRPPQVLPYLEADYWKAFPGMPAADFARFLALVKSGRPFTGAMMIAGSGKQPEEFAAALKYQQKYDLERSFEYARKELGLGLRGRV